MINERLREHTTNVAFHLTLSRHMIMAMQRVKCETLLFEAGYFKNGQEDIMKRLDKEKIMLQGVTSTLFVTGFRALETRGLVENLQTATVDERGETSFNWKALPFRLTPAGEKVWGLLEMAGLVVELSVPANEQKEAS